MLRIYNNLDIFCQYCKQAKKLSDIDEHERLCNLPKCVNYEICQGNVKPVKKLNQNKLIISFFKEFKDKECCDLSCYLLVKLKQTNGNWSKALDEIKDFLKEYQVNYGVIQKLNSGIQPGIMNYQMQSNSSRIFFFMRHKTILLFRWSLQFQMGSKFNGVEH